MREASITMEASTHGWMEINIHGCTDEQMESVRKQFDLDERSCLNVFIAPTGFYRNESNIPEEYKKTIVEVTWYGE